jgi:cytidylate kinase
MGESIMKEGSREEPKIVAAAERKMREWELTQQMAVRTDEGHSQRHRVGHFVTISREAGAGGGEVAKLTGQRLNWPVFDKNLLDQVAERFQLSRSMLELVDETESSWVYDMLGAWVDRKIISHEKFVVNMERIVLHVARQGDAVFVGRGTPFLLPRDRIVSVRLVASEKFRIARIARQMTLTPEQAKHYVVETDRGRREFVERFFHHDITDAHLYDLVINTESVGLETTAELIINLCCRRWSGELHVPAVAPAALQSS